VTNLVRRRGFPAVQLLLSLIVAACSSATSLAPSDAGDTDTVVATDASPDTGCDPSITYASFGMSFLDTYCNRCHAWTQEAAQLGGSAISNAAGPGGFMPPGVPIPTGAERQELVQWIDCGAP